jgi:hypothetical protein
VLIVVDSNALFDDPRLIGDVGKRLLDLLGPAQATLVLSPVVLAELDRTHQDDVVELAAQTAARLKKLGRKARQRVDELVGATNAIVDAANVEWVKRRTEIVDHPRVRVADWPRPTARSLVERELQRRRPFLDKEVGAVGHRDAMIWLTVLDELIDHDTEEELVFVTADKGFLGDDGLHADLIQDIEGLPTGHNDPSRVSQVSSLASLVTSLSALAADSQWDSWRHPTIEEALIGDIQTLTVGAFVGTYDPRGGGIEAPEFDLGILAGTGDDWTLDAIDGPSNLALGEAPYGSEHITCTFTADLSLTGFMDKSEWYADDHPALDLWDSDWNDYMVQVQTSPTVLFTARMAIDDETQVAKLDEILSAELVTEAGQYNLG